MPFRSKSLPNISVRNQSRLSIASRIRLTRWERLRGASCRDQCAVNSATTENVENTVLARRKIISAIDQLSQAILSEYHLKPYRQLKKATEVLAKVNQRKADSFDNVLATFVTQLNREKVLSDLIALRDVQRNEEFYRSLCESIIQCFYNRERQEISGFKGIHNPEILQSKLLSLTREIDDLKQEKTRILKKIEDDKQAYLTVVSNENSRITDLKSGIETLEVRKKELTEEREKLNKEFIELRNSVVKHAQATEAIKEDSRKIAENVRVVCNEIKTLNNDIKEVKREIRKVKVRKRDVTNMIAQCRSDKVRFTSIISSNEKEIKRMQILKAPEAVKSIQQALEEFSNNSSSIIHDLNKLQETNLSIVRSENVIDEEEKMAYFPGNATRFDEISDSSVISDQVHLILVEEFYRRLFSSTLNLSVPDDMIESLQNLITNVVSNENKLIIKQEQARNIDGKKQVALRKSQFAELKCKFWQSVNSQLSILPFISLMCEPYEKEFLRSKLENFYEDILTQLA